MRHQGGVTLPGCRGSSETVWMRTASVWCWS